MRSRALKCRSRPQVTGKGGLGGGEVHRDHVLVVSRAGSWNLHTTTWNTAEASREFPSTLLIDTRTEAQRRDQGELPGAIVIDRTVVSMGGSPRGYR